MGFDVQASEDLDSLSGPEEGGPVVSGSRATGRKGARPAGGSRREKATASTLGGTVFLKVFVSKDPETETATGNRTRGKLRRPSRRVSD